MYIESVHCLLKKNHPLFSLPSKSKNIMYKLNMPTRGLLYELTRELWSIIKKILFKRQGGLEN
jgi:hypothetical protein